MKSFDVSSRQLILMGAAFGAVAALFALLGAPHLLMPAGNENGLNALQDAIKRVKGPATAVTGSLSGLGLLAGGGMSAMGIQQGMRIMITAGLAGGGVLLGNGLIK